MYSHLKIRILAHVAMTIMITLNSTTANISHTNTTNATLATTASASTDTRTAMTVVAETVPGFLSETSDFQVVNDKTTGTVFSVSTNNTSVDSFSTNITPAAAAAAAVSKSPSQTTTTTVLKNSTMHIPTSITQPNSTNETFSPVQEKASPTTTKSPPTNIKIPPERKTTINTKVTNNLPITTNSTSTIISISNAAANSSLLDSLVNKVGDLESTIYINISHGGKSEGAENVGTLLTGSSFSHVDSLASKMQSLPPEVNTSSAGLGKVKNSSQVVQPDANNSASKQPFSSTSSSLSSWRRTSRLRRGQRADAEEGLRQTTEIPGRKYDVDVGDDYSAAEGIATKKVRTQRSKFSYQEPSTHSKMATLKSLTPGKFPSKQFIVEGRKTNSVKSNVEKTEQLRFLQNQKKDNYFKKYYTPGRKNRQKKSNIFPLTYDLINKKKFSNASAGNKKSSISAMRETHQNVLPWRGCRLCLWLDKQKNGRNFLKSQYHKKRKHRSWHLMATNPTKMNRIHQKHRNYNENLQKNLLPEEVLRQTQNDGIPKVIDHRNETIRNKKILDFSQRISLRFENGEEEADSERVKTKTYSLIPDVNTSLIGREETSPRNYTKTNLRNKTDVQVSILSGKNIENHKLINTSLDIDKRIRTKVIEPKNHNCNNNKLNSVERSELLQKIKPPIFNSLETLTRTSGNLMEENNKDNQNRILNNVRSQDISNNSGFTFGKSTHDESLETVKSESSKDRKISHRTNNTISAKNLNISDKDKQNVGTRLMSFENKREAKLSFSENQMKKADVKDRQFLLIENSSVEIRNHVNFDLRNTKELPVMHMNEKVLSEKNSDSFEDFKLTNEHQSEDTLKKLHSFNKDREEIYGMKEISVQQHALNEDYTRNHFKSEDMDEMRNGYLDNDPEQRIVTEKNGEGLTDNEDDDVTVIDEEDDYDGADEESKGNGEAQSKMSPEYKRDRSVRADISHNLRNNLQRENERKEGEYIWLKNAYESIAYRQSYDFFLDPEVEKKRLERKVQRRWRNGHQSNWKRESSQEEDIYLPLQNNYPNRNYPYSISNPDILNIIQGWKGRIEDHQLSRIKRSPISRTSNNQKGQYLNNKFTESVIDEDNEKPCGNHGRHRSHAGGMHHLTRHQRQDVHRATHVRHRRDVRFPSTSQKFTGDAFGKAAYFSGVRELLQLRVKKRTGLAQKLIPRQHFTIELWIKPEGGQSNPSVILGK